MNMDHLIGKRVSVPEVNKVYKPSYFTHEPITMQPPKKRTTIKVNKTPGVFVRERKIGAEAVRIG